MFKNVWFQVHWFIGITAGIVLAVVGLTGGILSFERDIQGWLNSSVQQVEPLAGAPLSPAVLAAELQKQYPDKHITAFNLSGDPTQSARVTFAASGEAPAAAPGRGGPRGETLFVNPYTGAVIAGEGTRGQTFFRMTRSLHRWLTAGELGNQQIGKQIVGASTLLCVVLALSGLYLRWPRRLGNWRTWLTFDPALKGRSFLWHLHAVLGTWVLVGFLLMSLTGLYWSYDWYRNGLYSLAGVERPAPRGEQRASAGARTADRRAGDPSAASGTRRSENDAQSRQQESISPAVDLDLIWARFGKETAASGFSTATLTLPQEAGRPVEIRYVDTNPEHERASNTLALHATTAAVVRHERYAEKRTGEKFMASIFPLHSGSFFGLPGKWLYMLASLGMPVFAVTGWMMYLDRRRKKRAANMARSVASASEHNAVTGIAASADRLLLAFASQAGSAREIAWQTAGSLRAAGITVDVESLDRLKQDRLQQTRRALFVVSTFGEGEPPDEAKAFARRVMRESMPLHGMQFGVLALGDRQYETFCGFGHSLDQWLRRQGAQALFPAIEVSNGDPKALTRWRERLGGIAEGAALGAWEEPSYSDWRLMERVLLNPGSIGGSTFHLELAAPAQGVSTWKAGDIAEIQPANSEQAVLGFLMQHALDANAVIKTDAGSKTLVEILKYSSLPVGCVDSCAEVLALSLEPLPKREFSIASVPQDGRLHLVIRQARKDDGTLGIGSGWLTEFAAIGDTIRLRIRSNPGFHAPANDRPMILIGNGTGIAGLRSLLKSRISSGHAKHWLVFGERNVAHDFYYRDEITAWQSEEQLQRVDMAFSRDQADRIYVQQRLREQADTLRTWIAEGAAVYVCGSADGMAPAVDATLVEVLGEATMKGLTEEGRYRRDVY